jgi:hypothetical protein
LICHVEDDSGSPGILRIAGFHREGTVAALYQSEHGGERAGRQGITSRAVVAETGDIDERSG